MKVKTYQSNRELNKIGDNKYISEEFSEEGKAHHKQLWFFDNKTFKIEWETERKIGSNCISYVKGTCIGQKINN